MESRSFSVAIFEDHVLFESFLLFYFENKFYFMTLVFKV